MFTDIPIIESFTCIIEQIIEKYLQLPEIKESVSLIENMLRCSRTGESFLKKNKFQIEDYSFLTIFIENFVPEPNVQQSFNLIKTMADVLQPLKVINRNFITTDD